MYSFYCMQRTFHYDSDLWSNNKTHNPQAGLTGFDNQESKLSSYWAVPFTKLCLGMKHGSLVNWIPLSYAGASLHALLADGVFRKTSLPISTWKSLLSGSQLQVSTL